MNIFLERKSVRNYDPNHKISIEKLTEILKETYRAPSSMNMQSSRMFVIQSDEAKAQLKTVLYGNELQLSTSSAMILIASDRQKFDYAEKIYNTAYEKGIMPLEVRDRQINNMKIHREKFTTEILDRDGYIDGGLLAMQLMLVAKSHGYDTCAIGGFNRKEINKALNLPDRYTPVLIISIGKAMEPGFDSIRLDIEDTTKFL